MSNGQNNAGLSQQLALQLTSLLGRDRMVNGDQLTSILAQVSQARRVLDSIEQEANNRHASYQEMVQQLSARVQQGAEAEQMLRRLGAPVQQIQPNPPPITGAHIVHPPQADGYYFQQPQIQRVPYEAAAAAAQARAAGPSVMQQQSFQSNLHAAQARQPPVTQQFQQAPQPVAQQYYNDFSAQQRPPPPQNAPVAQMHSRAPVPVATSADPNQYRHYREHVGRHEPVRHRPSTSSPVIHPQQGPPTRRQSQSPQIPSPQVPSVAFPPLAPRGTSTRPTVLGGGPTSNAQKASTSISQPTQTSNATAASSSQSTSLTPQQLTAITMKCHDLLKPQSREVLESVIKIVMKEMHIRGKMDLTQNDVEQVYSWKLDPRIAPEVIPLVQTIVQDLTPLRAAQATPILRLIIHTVNRPQHPVNTNVQQLGPRPGTPSTGTSIGNTGSGSVENRPVSSTISVVPQVPNPLLPHGISNSPQVTPRPSSAQPSPLPVSHDPSPFVVPTCISGNETYTQIGVASSTLAVNGHLESEHPANLSAKQTVLNMPSSSQMGSPSTPPTNRRDVPLTPNTKTLARDILRSLGRPINSRLVPSSQSNPGPSSLPTGQQEEFTTRPQTQDSLTNVPTQPAPVPDLQYREKEVIIIDDDSSVSSHPALIDEINGESLSGEPTETPQQQQPPPPPPVRELSSPPSPPSPVAKHTEPILSQADFGVEEIRTPGVMQMAYEEVQEMLQAESNIPAPRTAVDEVIGASTITVPVPTSSSPIIDSAASLPPRSRSSTPTEPMIIDFTPDAHPVAGPSKEPLFLASSPASSSADVENQMTIENDESRFNSDVFVPTGLLGFGMPPSSAVNKGKGRALEPDSDEYDTGGDMQSLRSPPRPVKRRKTEHMEASDSEVVETSESDERVYRSPPQRGLEVYVEVPPMSERCKRYRRDMEWRAGVSGEGKRTNPLVVLSSSSGSDVETGEIDEIEESDDGRQQRLNEEREAVRLSTTRLCETSCRWKGCDAILVSAERLGMHLQLHASEKRSTPFICDWEDCGRRFASRKLFAEHCTHHSEAALMCAYANCSIVALTPRELVHHQTQWNHQTQTLKREANVYRPQLDRLPPLPATYPAYKSVPLRISRARMRRDQHVWVGSKIAANITCYVHPGNRSNAAAPSRTSLRLAEKVADVERRAQETGMDPTQAVLHMSHGQYDSWLPYSSQRGPRYCSDLLSSYVTALVTKGLVIGAEYLAGDRRLPFEEEEEDQLEDKDNENSDIIDVDEGAQEVGNESDRTIIVDDLPRDELKGDAAADAIMANGQAPEGQADDRVRIEVLHPLSSASTPTSHGDQDKVDKDDADGAGSDVGTLSQPEWDVLRRDKEDVDGLL